MESNPGDSECSVSRPWREVKTVEQIFCSSVSGDKHPPRISQRVPKVSIEPPAPLQPGMAERAIDTATDVSRTITDVSAALQTAVDRLSAAIATARQPGKPLATLSAITREAPLASLFVAFLFGVAVARRR
jgi:hypothetical protein